MAVSPVTGPTPESVARVEALCDYMPQIALAVNGFADRTIREWAFHACLTALEPDTDAPVDVVATPQWGNAPASAVELGRLANWIADKAPMAWRDSVAPEERTVDAAIRFLDQGAAAWSQMLLVKHALMTAGGFTAEQVDGDLVPLIQELASDAPISPEIEHLAVRLKARAKPGETAPQLALRLLDMLSTEEDLRREVDKVDDREQGKP